MSVMLIPSSASINRKLARRHLRHFVRGGWDVLEPGNPYDHNWHIDAVCDHLQAVAGKRHEVARIRQLLINIPPGHMKSLLVAVFWPAWVWIDWPEWRALFASYAAELAIRDSVRCRSLIESDWYQQEFTPTWELSGDQNVKSHFENTRKGFRMSLGVGGATTGFRGNVIVVDDSLNAKDAHSDVKLAAAQNWWDTAYANRVNDARTGGRVVIGQRLRENDLPGVLLDREPSKWEHLCLPSRFEEETRKTTCLGFTDPRTVEDELLFPLRFPADVLQEEEDRLLESGFAGQHQQRPAPKSGSMFKEADFEIVDVYPTDLVRLVRAWDAAGTPDGGAWTVGCLMGKRSSGKWIVLNVVRGQWDESKVSAMIKATAVLDGPLVDIAEEQEPGSAGKAVIAARLRLLAGYTYTGKSATGDKVTRAKPLSSQVGGQNVQLYRDPTVPAAEYWIRRYLDEFKLFPNGKWKDQVDASSLAFEVIALGPTGFRKQKLKGH